MTKKAGQHGFRIMERYSNAGKRTPTRSTKASTSDTWLLLKYSVFKDGIGQHQSNPVNSFLSRIRVCKEVNVSSKWQDWKLFSERLSKVHSEACPPWRCSAARAVNPRSASIISMVGKRKGEAPNGNGRVRAGMTGELIKLQRGPTGREVCTSLRQEDWCAEVEKKSCEVTLRVTKVRRFC